MNAKELWLKYCKEELESLRPILERHGYTLETDQPHMSGERFLMQAISTTGGKKLILLGKSSSGMRVIIKATRDVSGIQEITQEHTCREILEKINFAGSTFHSPDELFYKHEQGFCIAITRFIEQTSAFLERRLEDQYLFALQAFKEQEGTHATTYTHKKLIVKTFGIRTAQSYREMQSAFVRNMKNFFPSEEKIITQLEIVESLLAQEETIIEQYCGFLTHTDFVPHNIRITGNTIYLLDHSSLVFGNKYDGWARFINFMTLHNPPLERALTTYVHENRTPEESVSLRMMRLFRLGEIIWYYAQTINKSDGDLRTLNTSRMHFWNTVLTYILKDSSVPQSLIAEYTATRDSLRSEDEKRRQKGLH